MGKSREALAALAASKLQHLRDLPFDQLMRTEGHSEDVRFGWWRGGITVSIDRVNSDTVRVVAHGVLQLPILPTYTVHVDGFRRHRDGSIEGLTEHDYYEFD